MTGPSRPFSSYDGRAEVRGVAEAVWYDSVRDTTPKPPAPRVSNYPLRFERPGSENHQPISLSARSRVVIVPGVHCVPIVIGYQHYFCLNCRTFWCFLFPFLFSMVAHHRKTVVLMVESSTWVIEQSVCQLFPKQYI